MDQARIVLEPSAVTNFFHCDMADAEARHSLPGGDSAIAYRGNLDRGYGDSIVGHWTLAPDVTEQALHSSSPAQDRVHPVIIL